MTGSYQRFLGAAADRVVLPYLGGPFVETADRRLRIAAPVAPGYWRFAVRGRVAEAIEVAAPPDLSGLPAVRGYWLDGYLIGARGVAHRFGLGPPDEPRLFAPLVARRWPDGALLFDVEDFETGVEDRVRAAFEARGTLETLTGVPAALRAAFGYAVAGRAGVALGVPVRFVALRARVGELAAEGEVAARRVLMAAWERRAAEPDHVAQWRRRRDEAFARRGQPSGALDRAAAALHAAAAVLRSTRWLADGLLEVRYDYLDDQFVSIVDANTLQVVDAGICLAGEDRRVTLESLPGVIAEAARTGRLEVTAW